MPSLSDLFTSYVDIIPSRPQFGSNLATQQPSTDTQEESPSIQEVIDDLISPYRGPQSLLKWSNPQLADNIDEPLEYVPAPPIGKDKDFDPNISDLLRYFEQNGIKVRITSGKRAPGQAGKAGNKSHHVTGRAIDIAPGEGETWETLRDKIIGNKTVRVWMQNHGLGIIDETDPEIKKKTGATGDHFHIGPDKIAVNGWGNLVSKYKADWTSRIYNAYYKALKEQHKDKYSDEHYKKIASYMTQQSAVESGYGTESRHMYNYGGHMYKGKVLDYKDIDSYVKAHMRILEKWPVMEAQNLKQYVDSLYTGKYRYNAHSPAENYYSEIANCSNRVKTYIARQHRYGGKFEYIKQLHEQSFSKRW